CIELVAQHRAADLDHGETRCVELREALEVLADLLRAAHARKQAEDGLAGLVGGLHGVPAICVSSLLLVVGAAEAATALPCQPGRGFRRSYVVLLSLAMIRRTASE